MTAAAPIDQVLDRLEGIHQTGKRQWSARCPAHDDQHASLSISVGADDRVLVHCHANCPTQSILSAIGLKVTDLFPSNSNGNGHAMKVITATYDYISADGELLYQVVRWHPKDFRQRRPDGKGDWIWNMHGVNRVLYKLPALLNAFGDDPDPLLWIVEGEKDADRLEKLGLLATCNAGGAGKWLEAYTETLCGRRCCIITDKDKPGRDHVETVAASLLARGGDVKVIECPGEKVKDVSDFIDAGGTVEQLLNLYADAPPWKPGTAAAEKTITIDADGKMTESSDPAADRDTELANAEQVHRLHGADLRYDTDRGEYIVWAGCHWTRDENGQVDRWAKEVARASVERLADLVPPGQLNRFRRMVESARGISGVLRLLQTEMGVSIKSGDFDRDDYLVNVRNGTIDLRSGTLRPHDRRDFITHRLDIDYDQTAACPLWESVIARSMGDNPELIGYLQRWAGLFLTGCPNIHELLIAYGSGANGKSVIFDTLLGLLGSYAGVAPESLLVARHGQSEHPTELADLLGKRLVIASETESGATLRLGLIKRLTGDATIKARFMRQDFFEFRRTHKLVLITNHRPKLTESTEAVWRRLRLLPFNIVIPPEERDPDLIGKLVAERPGILAWCVRGCLEWQRDGMNPPAEVMIATNEYREDADELADFIATRCIEGDSQTFRVSRADLHAAYLAWANQVNERHPLERAVLYEAIRRRPGIQDAQWKVNGMPVRGFKGIGMAAPATEGSR